MKFSILIPTYNRRDVLARTLSAAFAQDFAADDFEVVVAIDGSEDGTLKMLQAQEPACGFRYITQPNRGLPSARNAALQLAQGEYVLILDDDIVCEPSVLRKHLEARSSDNQVIFGPVRLHPESRRGLAADQWATWAEQFETRLQGSPCTSTLELAIACPAVNRSIARHLLLSIGGCDEAMKDCHEDWDLGIRLWKAGAQFCFQPQAVSYHYYIKSDRDLVEREARLAARGEVALSRKHPEYRPVSMLATMGSGSWRRRLFVGSAARLPFSPEPLLRPFFLAMNAQRSRPLLNKAGARLMYLRSGFQLYKEAARATGSPRALEDEFGVRLPVLAYHHVGTPKPGTYPDLSITAARFERHVRWMHARGYRTISCAEWVQWRLHGTPLPRKPVLLTFDDAFADIGTFALPVLRRYGFTATVFVVTGQIGGTNAWDLERGSAIHPLMSVEQLRYWSSQGIDFGAHSQTHPSLTGISVEAATRELRASRDVLASLLDRNITACAYPYGQHNDAVCDAARTLFDLAFTTEAGLNDLSTDLLRLKRCCIGLNDSALDLGFLLRWGRRPLSSLRARMRPRQRLEGMVRRFARG